MNCNHVALLQLHMQAFFDQFISSAMHEVRADYSTAMQRAMLDYVLSNPLERQRLGLQGLEPLLVPRHGLNGPLGPPLGLASQQRLMQRQLPQEWREHVALARCVLYCLAGRPPSIQPSVRLQDAVVCSSSAITFKAEQQPLSLCLQSNNP
eukprot:GHRQ01026539.1.p1 GENE.GHRQ01026539.1~~GHRQ01026539.1.p1  ORF type:complete len:151 (+),score=46.61 GHRQ01026539.1:403-855(+)